MMMMTMGSKKCAVSRAPRPVGSNFWGERTRIHNMIENLLIIHFLNIYI